VNERGARRASDGPAERKQVGEQSATAWRVPRVLHVWSHTKDAKSPVAQGHPGAGSKTCIDGAEGDTLREL